MPMIDLVNIFPPDWTPPVQPKPKPKPRRQLRHWYAFETLFGGSLWLQHGGHTHVAGTLHRFSDRILRDLWTIDRSWLTRFHLDRNNHRFPCPVRNMPHGHGPGPAGLGYTDHRPSGLVEVSWDHGPTNGYGPHWHTTEYELTG